MNKVNDELERLKAENASLKRKLKGVRAAKKREAEKSDKDLVCLAENLEEIKDLLTDRKLRAKLNFQLFLYCGLEETFVDGKRITRDEWLEVLNKLTEQYRRLFGDLEKAM